MLTALELAQAGLSVRLLEKGTLGRESSWAGGGILSPLYPWRYPAAVTALARWSQNRYPELATALLEAAGIDPQWTPSGLLLIEAEESAKALAWAASSGNRLELIGPEQLGELEPASAPATAPALWMPEVAQIRNPRLLQALRKSLETAGVEIREGTEVLALTRHGERLTGLETAAGWVAAGNVVIACGAWSRTLLAPLEPAIQVVPVRGQMILLQGPKNLLRRMLLAQGRYVIPRRDGRVLVGSTLEFAGFDKSTTEADRHALREAGSRLVPALAQCSLELHWSGLRPGSPNGVPYIGPHPGSEGLYVNTGHYRNGLVLAPGSAHLLADAMLGRNPLLPLEDYSLFAPRLAGPEYPVTAP
jgi:glycine oxidase